MISFKKFVLTLTFLTLLCLPAFCQPEDPDAPTPFGLVEILIGAGALYGGKKVYQARAKKE